MGINGLVSLLIYLVILGLIFYIIDWAVAQIPMFAPVRMVIRALLALILVVYLLEALGLLPRVIR